MKTTLLALIAIILLVIFGACSGSPQESGFLQGVVSIGPIWPVETPGTPRPIPPEVYAARKVMVYDGDRIKLIRQVDLSDDGHYRVDLKPGTYVIDINHAGIDRSSEVPKQVRIEAGQIVQLDINIDTGIR
jgi:hypothetical protein